MKENKKTAGIAARLRRFASRGAAVLLASAALITGMPSAPAYAASAAKQKKVAVKLANAVIKSQNAAVSKTVKKGKKKVKKTKKQLTADRIASLTKLFAYTSDGKFSFIRENPPVNNARTRGRKNWYYSYAFTFMRSSGGSCYHFASAFAVLAKKATNLPVRICVGTSNVFQPDVWQPHGWVEVKIGKKWYTFDPNAARYSKRELKFSFVPAGTAKASYKKQKTYTVKL